MAYNKQDSTSNDIETTILNGTMSILNSSSKFKGTMTELRARLVKTLGKKVELPKSPSQMRLVLNKIVNRLRSRGVSVKFNRAPGSAKDCTPGARFVNLVK